MSAESMAQRQDRLNSVVIDLLKITTTRQLTNEEAIEVAIRLCAGIAQGTYDGDAKKAADLVMDAANWMCEMLRRQSAKSILAVTDGKTVQ